MRPIAPIFLKLADPCIASYYPYAYRHLVDECGVRFTNH